MKKLLLLVCLLCPAAGFAQQAQTGVNGFSFIAPMQVESGVDHNFLVDRTNPNERLLVLSLPPSVQGAAPNIRPLKLTDNVLTITAPKMAFQNDGKRHEFLATWAPELELFEHNSDQRALNQRAEGIFTYFFARNLEASVGDSYISSHDPARTLENVFLLLPRSEYTENDIRANVEYQPNALTNFGVRYDNSHTNFGQTDPFQSHILDSISQGYSFIGARMLSRTQRLRFTYSIFKITPVNHHSKGEAQVDTNYAFERPIHSGILEYRLGLNPTTVLNFTGGLVKMPTGVNYTFGINGDKRVGPFFWVGGGYSRALAFQTAGSPAFSSGLSSNSFFEVYSARVRGQPTRRTGVLLDLTMSREVSSPLVASIMGFMGRARFDYRLSDRDVLFASIESFEQNQNTYVQTPLSRNRFMVGIQVSLSSETDRRLNHLNEDAAYVALTDHQRRHPSPQ